MILPEIALLLARAGFALRYTYLMHIEREQLPEFLKNTYLFCQLDLDERQWLADNLSVFVLKPDNPLYLQGSPADEFFLVFSGTILLIDEASHRDKERLTLVTGDFFSQETLSPTPGNHVYKALAVEASIVLAFRRDFLMELTDRHPEFTNIFNLIWRSFQLAHRKKIAWLNPDEYVTHISRRHISDIYRVLIGPATLFILSALGWLLMTSLLAGGGKWISLLPAIVATLAVLWGIWNGIDWSNDYYIITNQRVVLMEKVILFYDNRQETPLDAILSVTLQTELLGRWLAFGDVIIRTYTGSIALPRLECPQFLVALIGFFVERSKVSHDQEEDRMMDSYIRQRLEGEETADEFPQPAQDFYIPSRPLGFLESLFSLRETTSDSIIYRTHWFILIRRTLAPFFLGLATLVALIFRVNGSLLFIPIVPAVITGCGLLVVSWIWWIYEYIDWRNDIYMITPEQVIDINRKPLGHEERRAAPLKNIQTIEFKRLGIWGLLFNFGTVSIRIGDTQFTFDYVSNPSEVQKELFACFMKQVQQEKKTNRVSERKRMVDWIESYHRIRGENNATENNSEKG
jgi:CRP-like cAMP-binding protein/uncharacterized membrane protein YdbT with pleckstrin-like domain